MPDNKHSVYFDAIAARLLIAGWEMTGALPFTPLGARSVLAYLKMFERLGVLDA